MPKRIKYMLASEVTNAIAQLQGETRLCALIQWRAGLRISEALAVKPSDLDLEAGTLTVQQGKGLKQRTVPMHQQLRTAFEFTDKPHNNRVYVKADPSWIFKLYARVGIHGTHTLRHSFARHMLNNGTTLNELQLLLGHAHLSHTLPYAALVDITPGVMESVP